MHVHGRLTLVEDPTELWTIVDDLVKVHEQRMPKPWRLEAPQDFVDKLLRQIVGFRIDVTRMDGKWKLNQNHPVERRERVVRALSSRSDDNSRGIAAVMVQSLQDDWSN